MNGQFSEDIWEQLSSLWRKEKKQSDEHVEYRNSQVRHLLNLMFTSRRAIQKEKKQEYDMKKAWEAIEKRTASRRIIPVWCRYAAAVVVVVFAVWFGIEQHEEVKITAVADSSVGIQPGSQKAELILANGERIVLDTYTKTREIEGLGVKITNDTSGGKLKYEAGAANSSTAVEYHILTVPKGGEYALVLPDGTQVWLNSETTLRFPVRFPGDKREVHLSGEGFFKVQKDAAAPFHVYTESGEITVLGTSFNVSSYREDRYWQTTLVEGSVKITEKGKTLILKPSEQYSIDGIDGRGSLGKVNTDLYTSWVNGKFYFKAYTFEEIVKKLERWYDFTMVYRDEKVKQMRFTGTIDKHRPLSEALQMLEITTDIRFTVKGKNIIATKI